MDDPPLPLVVPDDPDARPQPHLIRTEGARLVRVRNADDEDPRKGFTEAVILAEAELADGGTGLLLAWLGAWQQEARTSGRGRFAWVRLPDDPERVRYMPPWPRRAEGVAWYGWGEPNELGAAIEQAAATLPQEMRQAALRPVPSDAGPGDAH